MQSWQSSDILLLPPSMLKPTIVEPIVEVKFKLTGIERASHCCCLLINNHRMINHKHERGKKKYKLFSYFCDGRMFRVYDVEGSTFAPALVCVWFSLFLKPGDFFNITRAISLRINSCFKNTRQFIQSKEKSL